MIRRLLGRRRSERGAELVELAFILPMLLVVIVGVFEYAFFLQSYEVVANAAREGARIRVLPCYDDTDAVARVNQYAAASGIAGTPNTTFAFSLVAMGPGAPERVVDVNVQYTHNFTLLGPMLSLLGGGLASGVTFTATSQMRCELGSCDQGSGAPQCGP